jgi:hypothetical protein
LVQAELYIPRKGGSISWAAQDGPAVPCLVLQLHSGQQSPTRRGSLLPQQRGWSENPPGPRNRNRNRGTPEYPLWTIPFEVAKVKNRWSSDALLTHLRHHTQLSLADLRGGATVAHRERACTDPNAQNSRSPPVMVERGQLRLIQGLPPIPQLKVQPKHRYYTLSRRLRVGSLEIRPMRRRTPNIWKPQLILVHPTPRTHISFLSVHT